MAKKLLNKSTGNILIFSVLILLISAPLFYFTTNYLYMEETDETLNLHKEEFMENDLPGFRIQDIAVWNKYNRNVSILPANGIKKDTVFVKGYFDKLENEDEPYRELNAPITIEGKPYTFSARINLIEKRDMVFSTGLLFLLIIVLMLTGILIITKTATRRLWKPFYITLEQIRGFEIDKNQKPEFPSTDIDEFNNLNASLERLIDKNTNIYNTQREFIENAAHELQTPLALFQSRIDIMLQLDLSKEQSVLVGSLNNDVARMNRLNKNLLLLSKIENENFPDKQEILLNEYIKKHLDFFTEQAKSKNLSIITEFTENLKIIVNPALLEVLLNNLFLNSIRHNVKNGKIVITIAGNTLAFLNSGQEAALSNDKLFNRFSKSDPSSQGNGLGLAIVKKITELNHWNISYSFYNSLHGFTITF
ncbi:sensor histidine kinase [Flavobacterium sp.]|uniref:sensor histidine kinase n=1 Tax=Flavobacterium sp. TaxID=239 RepID=UPI003B9D91F7